MKQYLTFILLLLLIFSAQIDAQKSTARFLYWSPSAEITGLGGAGVAIVDNSFSAYYNPASFAFSKKIGIAASFMQPYPSFGNTSQAMLSLIFPIKDIGTIAFSLNAFWMDAQIRTHSNSPGGIGLIEPPEIFKPNNYLLKASYSKELSKNIALGISAGLFHSVLSKISTAFETGNGTSSTILLDGGFLIKDLFTETTFYGKVAGNSKNINPGISVGFSLLNFGPKISYIDAEQSDPPPSMALLGFSYTPYISKPVSSRILLDFEKRIYDSNKLDYIHFGAEATLYNIVSLRAGYVSNAINSDQSYPTFGIGINYKFIYLNISRYEKYFLPTWQFDVKFSLGE